MSLVWISFLFSTVESLILILSCAVFLFSIVYIPYVYLSLSILSSVGEDSWESLGLQGDPTSPSWRRSVLVVHWKDWCWSWNSSTLATWCEELTHWKRPWCWDGLGAGGQGDGRGWDGWMASLTQWTWDWVNSSSWWCTGRPGVLWFMGLQSRTRLSDWTELNWRVTWERGKGESQEQWLLTKANFDLSTLLPPPPPGGQLSTFRIISGCHSCYWPGFLSSLTW